MTTARPGGWIALGLFALTLGACAGTERPIFESLGKSTSPEVPPLIRPPAEQNPGALDAGMRGPSGPIRPPASVDEDGGPLVDPGLDPTADFPWLETLPASGRAGTCNPGRYVGAFECTMPGTLTGLPQSIAGEIAFTLQGSAELQVLQVEKGSIDGYFFIALNMTGQLDCRSKAFAALSTGNAVVFATGAFSANLAGEYDDQKLEIEGPFAMVNDSDEHCDGTFTVRIAP